MSSPSKKPAPHSHMASSTGMMLRPNGVRKKSAIHAARLTIHEAGVRNPPDFSDKLVEDWRWKK